MKPKYPIEKLEAIRELLNANTGPVAIADALDVSRPTANKMIAEARRHFNMGEVRVPDVLKGEHRKAAKAAKMKAQGKSDAEVRRELKVGRKAGDKLLEMARESGVVAMIVNPEVMDAQVTNMLDTMAEISRANSRLKAIATLAENQLKTLGETTAYDVDRLEVGDVHGGWHQRMANYRQTLDVLRKVEDSITKGLQVQEKVMASLLEVNRINDMMGDVHGGFREALAELVAAGKLSCSVEEAVTIAAGKIRMRFARRKGAV